MIKIEEELAIELSKLITEHFQVNSKVNKYEKTDGKRNWRETVILFELDHKVIAVKVEII